MTFLSVVVFFPLVLGVVSLLVKRGGRLCQGAAGLASVAVAARRIAEGLPARELVLSGPFGVHLLIDEQSSLFILLAGLVVTALALDGREGPPFQGLVLLLLGACNAVFVSFDFFNLYVTVELVTILAFLLIRWGGGLRRTWAAVKYLMTGQVGMILYLLGALEAYGETGGFSMTSLPVLSPLSLSLMTCGLAVKGGLLFVGLWLPEAHGGATASVSALLSGVVVKTGLAPLLRFSLLEPKLGAAISLMAVASALVGSLLALGEGDFKRMLACSTLAQVGFIAAVPSLGGQYALFHGLAKAWLFLTAGRLPFRSVASLRRHRLPWSLWLSLVGGALALAGLPFLGAPALKKAVETSLAFPLSTILKGAALLTPVYLLRPLFGLPRRERGPFPSPSMSPLFLALSLIVSGGYFRWTAGAGLDVGPLLAAGAAAAFLPVGAKRKILPAMEGLDHLLGLSLLCVLALLFSWRWLP